MRFSGATLTLSLGAVAAAADIPTFTSTVYDTMSVVSSVVASNIAYISSSAMDNLKSQSASLSSASSSASGALSTSASLSSEYASTSASRQSVTASASSKISSAASVMSSASSVITSAAAQASAQPVHGDLFTCEQSKDEVFGACCNNLMYFSDGMAVVLAPQECKKAPLNETTDVTDNPSYKCDNNRIFGRCCLVSDGVKGCNLQRPIELLSSFGVTGAYSYTDYFPGYGSSSHDKIAGDDDDDE